MTITLRPEHEQFVAETLRSGAYQNPEEVIDRALEIFRSEEEWLAANRKAIDAKIQRGLEELDRGEGIFEDELDAYLDRLKTNPE